VFKLVLEVSAAAASLRLIGFITAELSELNPDIKVKVVSSPIMAMADFLLSWWINKVNHVLSG
jgi:hypothetical protein